MYPTRGANSSTCVHVKSRPKKWLMLGFPNNVLLKTLQGELYMLQIFVKYYLRVVLTFPPSGGSSSETRIANLVTHRLSAPPHYLIICSSAEKDYLLLIIISLSAPQLKKIICSSAEKDYLFLSWKRLSAPQLKERLSSGSQLKNHWKRILLATCSAACCCYKACLVVTHHLSAFVNLISIVRCSC